MSAWHIVNSIEASSSLLGLRSYKCLPVISWPHILILFNSNERLGLPYEINLEKIENRLKQKEKRGCYQRLKMCQIKKSDFWKATKGS